MSLPIYLIAAPDSPVRSRAGKLGDSVWAFDSVATWGGLEGKVPGLLLVDRSGGGESQILALAAEVSDHPEPWTLGVIDGHGAGSVRSLAFGPSNRIDDVARFVRDPGEAKDVLIDLRRTLEEIARVRHDVNNPLTAALAEVQLMLFDVEDEESKESLTVTQAQLRRIRDMMASTSHLRPPSVR